MSSSARRAARQTTRVFFIIQAGVPEIHSTALYQRTYTLSGLYDFTLLSYRGAVVGESLRSRLRVRQAPVRRPARAWRPFLTRWSIFALWSVWTVLRAPGPNREKVVLTTHNHESVLGPLLQLFGCRWAADILDLPEEQYVPEFLGAAGGRAQLKRLLLSSFLVTIRRTLRRADLVSTVGTSPRSGLAPLMLRDYHVPVERLVYLPNGVSRALLDAPPPERRPDRRFRLYYVGSIRPNLGAIVMLEALALLRERIPEVELMLVGDVHPAYREQFYDAVQRLAVAPWLQLTGAQPHDRVIALMAQSDVCLYPFLPGLGVDETMAVKVFEYLALAKPVVATPLSAVKEILTEGHDAIFYPPHDAAALAGAVQGLYQDESLRRRLGANGRETARRYSWDGINRKLASEWERLLGPGSGAAR